MPPPRIPWSNLFAAAEKARRRAYAPYSRFEVGAAAYFDDGKIYPGCNVENATFGLSLCAERNAIARARAEGGQRLLAMAVLVDSAAPAPPCGMCRQVMSEFALSDLPIRCRNLRGDQARFTLKKLLPYPFTRRYL